MFKICCVKICWLNAGPVAPNTDRFFMQYRDKDYSLRVLFVNKTIDHCWVGWFEVMNVYSQSRFIFILQVEQWDIDSKNEAYIGYYLCLNQNIPACHVFELVKANVERDLERIADNGSRKFVMVDWQVMSNYCLICCSIYSERNRDT